MSARAAAIRFSGDTEAAAESAGAQLLRAIKVVFESLGVDRIASENLAEELAKDKDSPWAAYGKTGKPITQRQIAALLDRYCVRPDSIRVPGFETTKKGYLLAWLQDFRDIFRHFLQSLIFRSGTPEQAYNHGQKWLLWIRNTGR